MRSPPHRFNPHRFARLILCAQAAIAWAMLILCGDATPARRRIRRRYRLLDIDALARMARNLMIARACMLARPRPQRAARNDAWSGFRRRTRARSALRAIAGSRLRRFLRAGAPAERLARLLRVLGDIDAQARVFLLPRAARGLRRLRATTPARPPHARLRTLDTLAPAPADTS